MALRYRSRPRFFITCPLLFWLVGQCIIDSASADPPPISNDYAPVMITSGGAAVSGTEAPQKTDRPQRELQLSREDLVPIPDMADVAPTPPANPSHPPLKVTIPDLEALKKRKPAPVQTPTAQLAVAGSAQAQVAHESAPSLVARAREPAPARRAAEPVVLKIPVQTLSNTQAIPNPLPTPIEFTPTATTRITPSQPAPQQQVQQAQQSQTPQAPIIQPMGQPMTPPSAGQAVGQQDQSPLPWNQQKENAPPENPAPSHPQPAPPTIQRTTSIRSAENVKYPNAPDSPTATVSSAPMVAVAVSNEPDPLPAYATMAAQTTQAGERIYVAAGVPEQGPNQAMDAVQTMDYGALAPAAGEIAETPLIPINDQPNPAVAASPAGPIATLPTVNSAPPSVAPVGQPAPPVTKPLLAANPQPVPAAPLAIPAPITTAPVTTVASPAAPTQARTAPVSPEQVHAHPAPSPVAAQAAPAPATVASASQQPPPVKKWTGPDAFQLNGIAGNNPAQSIAPSLPASLVDSTEPKRELSPDSKKIAAKIPAETKKKQVATAPINVDHAKDKSAALDKQASVTERSKDAMGIHIESKTARVNMDHELEKAYDALVSGRSDAAVTIYKNVLDNDANNKNALFGLATTYHRAGQLEMARPLYARLLSIDPKHRDGLNNFLVLLADEAPEDSLNQLEQLKRTNPSFSPIPAQMAVIYQKLGQPDKASENMLQAIKLAPENITYRYNFAIMLDKQRKYDEAASLYRQIIQAYQRGEQVPGNIQKIQQRLTFISSNRP